MGPANELAVDESQYACRREVGKVAMDGRIQFGQIAERTIGSDVALERPPDLLDGIEPVTTCRWASRPAPADREWPTNVGPSD